ncbi:hypothetical protein V2J09_004214 [Rumex salicifolius]
MPLKSVKTTTVTVVAMLVFSLFLVFFFSGTLQSASVSSSLMSQPQTKESNISNPPDPFTNLLDAFKKWDSQVGCSRFREKHSALPTNGSSSLQGFDARRGSECDGLKLGFVSILVKGWTWIPDNLDNLYSCDCGLSCLWTKSDVLADKPDALLFETTTPPLQVNSADPFGMRRARDPLRVYMDLEAGRRRSGHEDIFISYHAKDDVQATYAGALFHNNRNYYVSHQKNSVGSYSLSVYQTSFVNDLSYPDILVYWSSSRCLPERNELAKKLLSLLPHHSFGKCINNVGGPNKAVSMYPECASSGTITPRWWDHLHCSMSQYKFVLAIENTKTESYVTEKLFYALDSGAIPIYFGAPNVWDFVPPHSIIDGTKFKSLEELAAYVKSLADDPVAYAEYHAWRRCGVMGNYGKTREMSIDSLPCRLCETVSRRVGRSAKNQ